METIDVEVKDGCPSDCPHSCRVESGEIFTGVFEGSHNDGRKFVTEELGDMRGVSYCHFSVQGKLDLNDHGGDTKPRRDGYIIDFTGTERESSVHGRYGFIEEHNIVGLHKYPERSQEEIYNEFIEKEHKIFKKPILRNLYARKR